MLFLRASNHQLVDKINYIEFTVLKAFTSEFKLRSNPVKDFNGMCVRLTSITFSRIWSSVLISVTREWFISFFLINNIELIKKCSFLSGAEISQVMIKWRRRASHLGRFTLWHNGRRATQLGKFNLWHNGRRAKPGLMHAPGIADIFQRQ